MARSSLVGRPFAPVGAAPLLAAAVLALAAAGAGAQDGPAATSGPHAAGLFVAADRCMACHNGVITSTGEDVSIGFDWRASIMANSSRDPYWQAAVRREVMDHPAARAAIEDKCSTCHMPMMRYSAAAAGGRGSVFEHALTGDGDPAAVTLAADGVSCSVCHQILPDNLGDPASFTGGFRIDETTPAGERAAYGPFEVDAGRARLMSSATGLAPAQGTHLQTSEFCASCHTLYTESLDAEGNEIATLPEQVPYLEWRHSAYPGRGQSCQTCHMPVVREPVPVTKVLGQPRDSVSRHVFRGGNFFMLRMLNRYRDELGVAALPQELETAARRTVEHLQTSSARLALADLAIDRGELRARLDITNLGGHKLPTAYPSRRAWIRLVVRDREGNVAFESGAFRPDGRIEGNDNDASPDRHEPHYRVIERPDQVQIYESILVDDAGRVTTGLLTGVRYAKDNRLLPTGFDKATAPDDIAVRGEAAADPDFTQSGDRIEYRIRVDEARGPFHVEAEFWYQTIGFRWAENLQGYDAFETNRFTRYYGEMAGASGVVLARAEARTR